ncbi:MAG: hypothetical protein WC901_00790 [Candidatus Margulisiibacteriota bacterium]
MKDEMKMGERVRVKLHGDECWYTGTVMDRPRKEWVRLDDYDIKGFIADEHCIEKFERIIVDDAGNKTLIELDLL